MNRCGLPLLLAATLLSGCSGITKYQSSLEKNLHIQTKAGSGSMLQRLDAGLHLYEVDAKCELKYIGTVYLDDAKTDVGIPTKQMYLEFYFVKRAVLYSSTSAIKYGMLLQPRASYDYLAEVTYQDDMYKVQLRERRRGGGSSRLIERAPLESCGTKR